MINNVNGCRLKWLFAESTALFPSVYLRSADMSEQANMQYVTSRVEEALRVAQVSPVYVYMWSKYQDANRFLSKVCLFTNILLYTATAAVRVF